MVLSLETRQGRVRIFIRYFQSLGTTTARSTISLNGRSLLLRQSATGLELPHQKSELGIRGRPAVMMNINSSTSVMPVLPPLADRRVTDLLARRAAGQADETFIVLPHERETWTFGSLWESATRLATGLRSLGLGPGDKCAIILPNSAEYLLTWFASMIIGSVDASISGGLHGALLAHQLRIASVKVAICDDETRESVREIAHELPDLEVVVVVGQARKRQTRPRE